MGRRLDGCISCLFMWLALHAWKTSTAKTHAEVYLRETMKEHPSLLLIWHVRLVDLSLSLSLPQNITDALWGLYGVRWWIKKKEKSVVLSFALSHFLSLCVSTSFYIYISFYLSLSLSHSFNQLSFTRILALSLSFLSLSLALVCVTRGVWVPSGSISHQVMAAILETTHPK